MDFLHDTNSYELISFSGINRLALVGVTTTDQGVFVSDGRDGTRHAPSAGRLLPGKALAGIGG
jgi:hypothetical protein